MADILIADDERSMRDTYRRKLCARGHGVRAVPNGLRALEAIAEKRPDLVLMDIEMPRMDGLAACTEIRKADRLLPVLFLTANDTDSNAVLAWGAGADDFVPKTVSDAVLFSRIDRALRRAGEMHAEAEVIALGRIKVNLDTRGVIEDGVETARLTRTEFAILRLLASERGRSFQADEIYSALHGEDFAGDPGSVRIYVHRLRAKLGAAADLIAAERTLGYSLRK